MDHRDFFASQIVGATVASNARMKQIAKQAAQVGMKPERYLAVGAYRMADEMVAARVLTPKAK